MRFQGRGWHPLVSLLGKIEKEGGWKRGEDRLLRGINKTIVDGSAMLGSGSWSLVLADEDDATRELFLILRAEVSL